MSRDSRSFGSCMRLTSEPMVGSVNANLDEYLSAQLNRRVSREEVALALGVSVATLGRRKADRFSADDVITAARRFDISPIAALVDFGYLTHADLETLSLSADTTLTAASDLELAEEMLRRVRDGGAHDDLTAPLDDQHASVRHLRPAPVHPNGPAASDPHDMLGLADAADDTPDWEREDEERERD